MARHRAQRRVRPRARRHPPVRGGPDDDARPMPARGCVDRGSRRRHHPRPHVAPRAGGWRGRRPRARSARGRVRRSARSRARHRLRPEARRACAARSVLPRRDRTGGPPRRLLREPARRALPRVLRVPDALRDGAPGGRARPEGDPVRPWPRVRGRDRELRPPRDALARGDEEADLRRLLRPSGRRRGLALPDGGSGGDPPPHRLRGLPIRVGREPEGVRARDGARGPHLRWEDRALPLRHGLRAQGPASLPRRGRGGPDRIALRRPAPPLLPLRSADGPLQPARPRLGPRRGAALGPGARCVHRRHAAPRAAGARGLRGVGERGGAVAMPNFPLGPDQASSTAAQVDVLFLFALGITVVFSTIIACSILYLGVKYRRRTPGAVGIPQSSHSRATTTLEITWSVIPLVILTGMFLWGAKLYFDMARPPANAVEFYVIGKQWMWKIQHPEGRREINELHVPVGTPIKLTMTSEDVIHSFFLPSFRVKADVLPGRYSTLWFQADKTGSWHIFCSQYCGAEHSRMVGRVVVMEPHDYEAWLAGGGKAEGAPQSGEELFVAKACNTCHRTDSDARAPYLAGLFGSQVHLPDGGTATADETYVRESILNPQAKIVDGYQPLMPTFKGQLSEEEVIHLVDYVKSLKDTKRGG